MSLHNGNNMRFVYVVFCRIQEDHPVMSFTLNETGRLALLNVATQVTCC